MTAARISPRRKDAALAFDALRVEGGLLAPEWLAKVSRLECGDQAEADYGVPKGLNLRDEIGRFWRIAQAHYSEFTAALAAKAEPKLVAERFAIALLRDVFGFAALGPVESVVIAERGYPIGFGIGTRVPVVIAPAGSGLDTLSPAFGEGGRRRSPFGLVQEYLNAALEATWGIATDGVTLRIARDNASLTRPAWIEADLGRIFAERLFADFAALWLLAHASRFGKHDRPGAECALETWREKGREEGTRAREHLRRGVEDAVAALGQGFLAHPGNGALRAALESGDLRDHGLFNQLLRLVYRLIFLLTVEERGLLHPIGVGEDARAVYAEGYSMRRLRERSARRSAHDRHTDAWDAVRIVFRGLAGGEPRLGLPALAGLFAASQCPALDAAKLENRWLLLAVFRLAWLRDKGGLARVNWRDMGPEELGSVYESLLELVPVVSVATRSFSFATGDETKGNARKTSGSYYTPDSLVQVLLDSALEPVVKETIAANPAKPVEALLALSVVDPACGSGHFLLAAARRLAAHVARIEANGTPSAAEYRAALRKVVGRCIYGVDLNPMAVELCKVALWMEAVEPGLPLGFLDAHIQHGNALLGTTPELMEKGIPDAAWEPIEGDDRKVASALKKRNGKEASGQTTMASLWSRPATSETDEVTKAVAELDRASDEDVNALVAKESRWAAILSSGAFRRQKFVADAWCAAFVWPKPEGGGPVVEAAPTQALWRDLRDGRGTPPELTVTNVEQLAEQHRFFHWHLAFPPVFAKGGFDVVLGNPPWERVKLQEEEFFASRSEEIALAANAAARKRLIVALPSTDPALWSAWASASRSAEGQSHFVRQSGRYPLCGRGDVNTYAIFAEHDRALTGPGGRAGFIVPTGVATDDTTKDYFRAITGGGELRALFDFQTGPETFGNLAHGAMRFCLLTLSARSSDAPADLFFFAKTPADLRVAERHFSLRPEDFATLNPNTRTCPTFLGARDAAVNLALYQRSGVLWREGVAAGNPWELRFMAMFHMANDSGLFMTREALEADGFVLSGSEFKRGGERFLPLCEAKMADHFDHRYASLIGVAAGAGRISRKLIGWYSAIGADAWEAAQPQYWIPATEVDERLRGRWERGWLLGWRDICRSTDQRTVVASLVPRSAAGDTFLLANPGAHPTAVAALYANLCSFSLDYAARQKVGGTHLKYHTFKQLPVLPPSAYASSAPWHPGASALDFILRRVLELTYTAWDLESFAKDVGYNGPPFRWEGDRRFLLRCELDAAFFHLYRLGRDDTAYILDTFPIVRNKEEKAYGEFRSKRVILEVYDAMAEATRNGISYITRLDPPPADPRVAHPART